MAGTSATPEIRYRALGGAIGAVTSLVAALLAIPTIVGAIVGAVGIPVGAALGWAFGARVAVTPEGSRIVVKASVLAVPMGTLGLALLGAISEGRGADPIDLIKFTALYSVFYGIYGVVIGWPMALGVGALSVKVFRRLVHHVDQLWRPSIAIVAIVAIATAVLFVGAALRPGDRAAQEGDRVPLSYRVDNLSDRDYSLDIRSYWNGASRGGSSGYLGTGVCTSTGTDWLLASDWAIWLSASESDWLDRPLGEPVVSNETYARSGSIDLTIVVQPDGSTTFLRSVERCPNG